MASNQLQRELKKKQPFESPEQEASLNIVRTSDQFLNRFGKLFWHYSLTSSQYNVLRGSSVAKGSRCRFSKSRAG